MNALELARFERKVNKTRGCWKWIGAKNGKSGYGQLSRKGRKYLAHRVIYEHYFGKIAEGLTVDHLCRVHECVNPAHLELVSVKENVLRGVGPTAVNARRTECSKGHKYHSVFSSSGKYQQRKCRTCRKEYNEKYYRQRNAN